MSVETWLAFTAIASMATLIPGPAMLLVATHSIRYGVFSSLNTILGNVTGLAMLSGLSVAGLSTLLVYAPVAFAFVKIVGAIYLAYLGVKLWRAGVQPLKAKEGGANASGKYLYLKGIAIATTNPKAIGFTTALFPQFIDPNEAVLPQFFVFLCTFTGLSFVCLLGCAVFVRLTLKNMSIGFSKYLGRLFGGTLIGAGGLLLFSSNR